MSNTSVPVKANTFTDGQTILAAPINQNYDDLFTGLANVGTANLLADAVTTVKVLDGNITLAKLVAAVQASLCPAGTMVDFVGTTAPTGWVLASGRTIGNAVSGALERANADTQVLWELWYNATTNTEAPVSGGRTGNSTNDFNAGKTIGLPDVRGRSTVGKDNMGGSTAGRITNAVSGFVGTTQGAAGGAESIILATGDLAAHSHAVTDPGHAHVTTDPGHIHATTLDGSFAAGGGGTSVRNILSNGGNGATASQITGVSINSNTTGVTTQNAGSGNAHRNVHPAIVVSKIIKL